MHVRRSKREFNHVAVSNAATQHGGRFRGSPDPLSIFAVENTRGRVRVQEFRQHSAPERVHEQELGVGGHKLLHVGFKELEQRSKVIDVSVHTHSTHLVRQQRGGQASWIVVWNVDYREQGHDEIGSQLRHNFRQQEH